ncbi:lipopolysaccharide biosynthesis protein [Allosphingosinicella sp.]|uniref:lipopolysaccharide biosynthesis protein n=1 Tax=Allosphingosinicella sp. TaxID=2823234 RepID=UPI002EE29028
MTIEARREPAVTRDELARGAGLAGLARMGALIEAFAQPLYTWLFGLATYGLYVVLWGAVNLLANIVDLSMTSALQRVVPAEESEERAHGAVKLALLVSVIPAVLIAALIMIQAEAIATIPSVAPEDAAALPQAIALFAWALPLWIFVEVATSAARARRAFGPEIRVRILWEQLARIVFAALFFTIGLQSLGLMIAHLCSLALAAVLCVPLLARYYDLRLLIRAPIPRGVAANLLLSGIALLPSNLSRRMLIDAPPVVLNLMLPGARGAAAAGLFEIARKISTIPHIVRQSFQYVLGPLSSAQARSDRAAIAPLYGFASRVSAALVVPLGGLLIFAGSDILSIYRPEVAAALPLLWVLVAARALEAIVGPAATIVEMTGHRLLPLVNSLIGLLLWAVLAAMLTPRYGPLGMAIAIAAAIVASAYAATIELRISDGLSPFGRKLFQGLGVALSGVALMALAEAAAGGPARFAAVFLIWAATSWLTLRYGLTRLDREALGGVARRLRLV